MIDEDRHAVKDAILLATLPHVAFDGWTEKSLHEGVRDAGLAPHMALRAFPGGVLELAEHFSGWADRRMLGELEKRDLEGMPVRDRVAAAVRARLEVLEHHREAVRFSISFLSLPGNLGAAARLTFDTLNAVWRAAGDTSTSFNFYTKRGLLAPVYGATVLYWLSDASEGHADTWDFLDRRLGNVLKLPGLKAGFEKKLGRIPSPFRTLRKIRESLGPHGKQVKKSGGGAAA